MSKQIKVLEKEFKTISALEQKNLELKEENRKLKEAVNQLIARLDALDQTKNKLVKLEISSEELIIERQIQFLKESAMLRPLTLEETKILDLHIKNKRLLTDKSTINAKYKSLPDDMSDDELLRIAESVETQEEEDGA
ncbi:MAG TPA: hypothetical protein VIL26_04460 [Clostridia bacterium]